MPYNVERILLMAADMNTSRVHEIMTEFEQQNSVKIDPELLATIKSVIIGS